jgi:hypothetical protein
MICNITGVGHMVYPYIGDWHVLYAWKQLKNSACGERSNDVNPFKP